VFDSKSKAIEWLEGTGLPIEIASTKIKAPNLISGMGANSALSVKKVIKK